VATTARPVSDDSAEACGPARGMDLGAALDALRARGADRVDPIRFRFIEAMARRAVGHEGAARRILEAKLARLLAACGEGPQRFAAAGGDSGSRAAAAAARGPLAELVDHIARQASPQGDAVVLPQPPGAHAGLSSPPELTGLRELPELKALSHFRRTWSRLNAHQRLAQSRALVPENAGPLHSQQLVHRALTLMRDLSPEYLDHFMGYVDGLLWLDQASSGSAPAGKDTSRSQP